MAACPVAGKRRVATLERQAMTHQDTTRILWSYIGRAIEGIIGALADLEAAGVALDWRPAGAGANSVHALAAHALGATEHRLLDVLCGIEVSRDREAEFASGDVRSAAAIAGEWRALAARIGAALEGLGEEDLEAVRRHPHRGELSGLEVLVVVLRHVAEHHGQAELTRDLALAAAQR